MDNWQDICISKDDTIRKAVEVIDAHVCAQIALIVDEHGVIEGTLTDGDFRRAMLRKISLDTPVSEIMNVEPTVLSHKSSATERQEILRRKSLRQLILVDDQKRVVGLAGIDGVASNAKKNAVCLMAGGLGSRLRPLTDNMPKPLLKIGDRAILEIILRKFIDQGFYEFYISVNYLGDKIKAHFGDGRSMGCRITYLDEDQRLGTAGALSLIEEKLEHPLIVMNGDLLTGTNFENFIEFHENCDAVATMAIREYNFQVPFGVVDVEGHELQAISEKPKQKFFVNAGMYVLSPEAIAQIPKGVFFDMPTLFQNLMDAQEKTSAFPIREHWLDIGSPQQLQQAQKEYSHQYLVKDLVQKAQNDAA